MTLQRVEIHKPLAQIAEAIEEIKASRWEYHSDIKVGEFNNADLNKYGEEGWELVSLIVVREANGEYYPRCQAVFKRRV